MSDGYLEFTTANSIAGMGLGLFTRVGQSRGPVTFKFGTKEVPTGDDEFYTFVNVDGEFVRVKNTESITIKPAMFLEN